MNIEFPEVVAQEITAISTALKKLKASRLSDRTIVLLVHDALPTAYGRGKICGIPAVRAVLDAVENLPSLYLKKAKEANKGQHDGK